MSARLYHPKLSQLCEEYRCEDNCTTTKHCSRRYGPLGVREAILMLRNNVQIGLNSPWKVTINGMELISQLDIERKLTLALLHKFKMNLSTLTEYLITILNAVL